MTTIPTWLYAMLCFGSGGFLGSLGYMAIKLIREW